jgi:PAS domain S-box-containing protein
MDCQAVLDALGDAVLIYDAATGKIERVNRRLCKLLGFSPEEIQRLKVADLVREGHLPPEAGAAASGLQEWQVKGWSGPPFRVEARLNRSTLKGREQVCAVLRELSDRPPTGDTEARQAQSSLLHHFFSAIPDLLVLKDRNLVFQAVNPAFCQYLGKPAAEIIGKTDFDLFPPAEAEIYRRDDLRVMEAGAPLVQDEEVTGAEGREWLQVSETPVFDETGRPAGVLCAVRDIRQRKEMEEALRETSNTLQALIAAAPLAIIALDQDFCVKLWNPAAAGIFGWSEAEVLGRPIPSIPAEHWPETSARIRRELAGESQSALELGRLRKDGALIDIQLWTAPLRNAKGEIVGDIGIIADISHRKRTEQELRASEAKYRNLVEQIPAVTYIAGLDDLSHPIYISPQIEAILGFTPEEWLADPERYKNQIHAEDRDRVLTDLLLSYAAGGPFAAEYRFLSKTGRVVWVRDESRAVYDSEGQPLFMQGVLMDITKRKRGEEALREANYKLKTLVQASPLAIIGLNLQGKVISWNPAAERIFGWRAHEVVGRPHPIAPEEMRPEFKHLWQRVLQGEELLGLELRHLRRDGSLIDVSLSTAPLYDGAGRLAGAMGVFEDITARKSAAEAWRESEARFRAMFEGAPIGMALVDLERTILKANPVMREMLGYSETEIRGLRSVDLAHPDDREADFSLFNQLVAGQRNRYQVEKRYRHKQGQWVWTRLSVSLVRDAVGRPQFAISMLEDITEQRQTQEAAEEIRRQQEAILSNIADMAWLKDRESRFIAMNDTLARFCGGAPGDLVGKTDLDIWPPELALKYQQDDQEVMQTGKRKRMEEPLVSVQGNLVWVETIKTPIFNERGKVVGTAGIARDITERRRMEEALRKLSRALKAVTECDQALLRAHNEAELLSEVCRIIVEVGGYLMAWVGFARQDEEKSVQPMAHKGFEEGYMQTFKITWADEPQGQGPVGTAIRTGKPAVTLDTQTDPCFAPWREEAFKRGYASVLALPLGNASPIGALAIYAAEANAFDDEEINLLLGLANDLSYGIKALRAGAERQRAEEARQDSEQKLRLLASQLLTVQEKERRRVSRELHDELGQALTVLKIHLGDIEKKLRRDQPELKASCEHLLGYIDAVIENVRRLSWDLSPSILEDLGLSSSLKYLVQETCRNHHMLHAVALDEIDQLFSPEARINIYRIFQEALTNIVRHADATRIDVEIKKEENRVSFLIKDNGKGFDLKKARPRALGKRGLGLTTMQERALLAGGTLSIRSQKGKGTAIKLTVPLQP